MTYFQLLKTDILKNQGFKNYFFNTSWMMAEKIFRMTVYFTVGVYVIRYLGPEDFGLLSYAISFIAIFSAFATLGLNNIVTRNLVCTPEDREIILGSAFALKVIGALLLLFMVATALQMTSNDKFTKTLVMIVAIGVVFQSFNVIEFYFHSQVQAKFAACALLFSLIASSLIKLLLIFTKSSLLWFSWEVVLENAILAASLIFIYHRQHLKIYQWRFQRYMAIDLLRDSWPLILSDLAIMIYMRIDQVMIKVMLNNEAVGNYSAAVKLSEVWYFIPIIITNSVFPAIINAKKKSETLYYERLQHLYDLMTWMAVGIALPMSFFSDKIISLLFGAKYLQAAPILAINIWAGVFVFLGVASGMWFISENLQIYSFYRTFCGCIANVILNLLLIPKYGIKGAAISTLLSYSIATYFSLLPVKKTFLNFKLMTYSLTFISIWKKKAKND